MSLAVLIFIAKLWILTRVADPGGVDPDPDFKIRSDPVIRSN